jgi:hypothetical protein
VSLALAKHALLAPGAVFVCDIDGTIALDAARQHLRPTANPHCLVNVPLAQIERYMAPELVALDAPMPGAAELLTSFERVPILFVTARWEALRRVTKSWLALHYPGLRHRSLRMRRTDDRRPSVEVKLELVDALEIRGGAWLDDDPDMLAAAERRGFAPLKAPDIYRL